MIKKLLTIIFFAISFCFSQKINFEIKTESYNGSTAPRHAIAVWVQTPNNEHVKTISVWSHGYNFCLMMWRTITGLFLNGIYDGITQATISDHNDLLNFS